jgi:hypothetical protein
MLRVTNDLGIAIELEFEISSLRTNRLCLDGARFEMQSTAYFLQSVTSRSNPFTARKLAT